MTAGRRWRVAGALVLVLASAGCGTAIQDSFHNLPPESTPQPDYPAIGAIPPPRAKPAMTEEERKKAEEQLRSLATARQRSTARRIETRR